MNNTTLHLSDYILIKNKLTNHWIGISKKDNRIYSVPCSFDGGDPDISKVMLVSDILPGDGKILLNNFPQLAAHDLVKCSRYMDPYYT